MVTPFLLLFPIFVISAAPFLVPSCLITFIEGLLCASPVLALRYEEPAEEPQLVNEKSLERDHFSALCKVTIYTLCQGEGSAGKVSWP